VIPKEHAIFRFEIPLPPGATTRGAERSGTGTGTGAGPGTETGTRMETSGLASSSPPSQQQRTLIFELHGSQFENRPVDRANKKFKQRNLSDL
jgi:ribonuclease P protein subunit POP4